METRTVELATPAGPMPAYEAVPGASEAPRRGAVVVVQEAFGVNHHIEDVTRRFASAGYHGLAPHLFHRTGSPVFGYEDFGAVLEHMGALDDPGILSDLDAALGHLGDAGWSVAQLGVVGFCMGGRAAFLAATSRLLGAAVSFYGGGIVTARSDRLPSLVGLAADMGTPWLGLFGDEDRSIPVEDVETLREAVAAAPVDCEIVRYPGAEHGFHCDARPSYAPAAAADAWRRTLDWLDAHLARPTT